MNESQARQLAALYESMGYEVNREQTGGNVWLVTVSRDGGPVVQFGIDTIVSFNGDEMVAGIAL